MHTPHSNNGKGVRKFRLSRAPYRRSQLQKQIARRKTTVQVTGLSGPTTNCITGLSLRLIIFSPHTKYRSRHERRHSKFSLT